MELNLDSFKEPRGFIKILQWVFGICAFATTLNFSTNFGWMVSCNGTVGPDVTVLQNVEYPFDLDHQSFSLSDKCGMAGNETVEFLGNAVSDAKFFVTTGILSFLYSMAAISFYLLAEKTYQTDNRIPLFDFVVALVLAIFWLSGSAAWAKGVSSLTVAADPAEWAMTTSICSPPSIHDCRGFFSGNFSNLVVSILFGFINFVLWGGNLWFLYKETTWFESIMKNTATPNQGGN